MRALYITHPEVRIDPAVPTPQWGLNDQGRARATAFVARGLIPIGTRIVASTERKAVETAEILAAAIGGSIECGEAFGENDRSATGYLPPAEFEAHVAKLFGSPDQSVAGWETARAAQNRIVGAVTETLRGHDPAQPIVFVGHGCVGTLLKCHVSRRPIAQAEDQRVTAHPGGGNVLAFALSLDRLVADWRSFESVEPAGLFG